MMGRIAIATVVSCLAAATMASATRAADGHVPFRRTDAGLEAYHRLDFTAAHGHWMRAARRGDARAETWIGIMHAEGKGVARDPAAAIRWFTRAAQKGYAEAEFRLGVIYEFGHGVPEDKSRARHWYRLAADHAHVEAQIRLSTFHEFGIGTAVNHVRAYVWADIAHRIAPNHAQRVRAGGQRDTMAEMMTPGQIAEARRSAKAWFEQRDRVE